MFETLPCPSLYICISHLVPPAVPANLEDSSRSLVAVYELAALSAPDVNTFVKTPAGQKLPVRRKCDTVDWLLVPGESMDTRPSLHVPQPHCGVKAGGGQDEVHVGVVGAGPSGTPLQIIRTMQCQLNTKVFTHLDGVNLLGVSLKIMDTNLPVHGPHLQSHVVTAGSQKFPLGVPLDGVNLVGVALE